MKKLLTYVPLATALLLGICTPGHANYVRIVDLSDCRQVGEGQHCNSRVELDLRGLVTSGSRGWSSIGPAENGGKLEIFIGQEGSAGDLATRQDMDRTGPPLSAEKHSFIIPPHGPSSLLELVETRVLPSYLVSSGRVVVNSLHGNLAVIGNGGGGIAWFAYQQEPTKPIDAPAMCAMKTSGGQIIIDHQTIVVNSTGRSDKATGSLIINCTARVPVRLRIMNNGDIPTSLTGVTSTIAFDGSDYVNTYNYNGPQRVEVSSIIKWPLNSSVVGEFQGSGTVLMEVL